MLLKSRDGSEFEATLTGYESPEIAQGDDDWLFVSMRVKSPLGSGTSVDPCLRVREVEWLIEWLEAHANNMSNDSFICFAEPNLAFVIIAHHWDNLTLRVPFILEENARWKPVEEQSYRRSNWISHVDLEISREDMKAAAEAWRDDLRKFPPRAQS